MAQLVKTPAASAPSHLPVLQAVEPDVIPHKDDGATGHVDAITQRACSHSMDTVHPKCSALPVSNIAWQHSRHKGVWLLQLSVAQASSVLRPDLCWLTMVAKHSSRQL